MSSFLWVEDFEGEQYREFAYAIFGQALGKKDASEFPNNESKLRSFLAERHIFLATSYAEAARLIKNNLTDIDFIVLDIDLNLLGEDAEDDRPLVLPLLERWYNYEPNAENEEASYSAARNQMKMVAGYHLYIDLVMNRGFPQSRILFCSNHGRHLDRINKSFEPAKIEAPHIYEKASKYVEQWVFTQFADSYVWVRRWITLACREMLARLDNGKTRFKMLDLPGIQPGELTNEHAKILLETLPMLLPREGIRKSERLLAFRIFARILTQDWDKVDFTAKIERADKAFAVVLKQARNWTSHDAKACSEMTEVDAAFLFLVGLRACFELDKEMPERFEMALLQLIGKAECLDEEKLKQSYKQSFAEIQARYDKLPRKDSETTIFFDGMVNELQKARSLEIGEQMKCLMQILWHQLHWADKGQFSPRLGNFEKTPFLKELTQCLYHRSF